MAERRPNRVRGPGHDEFWEFCGHDELRLQRCDVCRHLSWPPVESCERCGRRELTWDRLSGWGTVISWCTLERAYYSELPVPWDTILVELDEGPLFISNPAGFTTEGLAPNTPVRVTFIDCEDDAGGFRLPVFERR